MTMISYTLDPTYRQFLNEIEQNAYPPIVLAPANDGMLHAFRLNEDSSTNATGIVEDMGLDTVIFISKS